MEEALLALEQVTTGVIVMAVEATRKPEQGPRVRRLLGDLLALLQEAKGELETCSGG